VQTLPTELGILLSHLFSLLLLLKQVLLAPTVEELLVFLAKLKVMASVAIVLLDYLTLEPVALVHITSSTSSLLTYFSIIVC